MTSLQAQSLYEGVTVDLEEDAIASECTYEPDHLPYADTPADGWRYRYMKRALDISCSLAMIATFAIPALLIAAAILLSSSGPVFYREERIGQYGRRFQIWKFRSMYTNAVRPDGSENAHGNRDVLQWRIRKRCGDPRITAIGGVLRSWSLDELPQLYNILRGEMSLIGPRPIVEAETSLYGDLLAEYLAVTPGLSGLWQVSGRSDIDYAQRARLDALYVRSWSLRADFRIFFWTIPAVLGQRGAR